jgi:AcrR family transcriptional regulator
MPSPADVADSLETRLLDACLECIARWSVAKTTINDVAQSTRCSRATIYRLFPGGRESLLHQLAVREVTSFFDAMDAALLNAV